MPVVKNLAEKYYCIMPTSTEDSLHRLERRCGKSWFRFCIWPSKPELPEELQKNTFWEFGNKEDHFKYRSAAGTAI